jgi:hypothetical protein
LVLRLLRRLMISILTIPEPAEDLGGRSKMLKVDRFRNRRTDLARISYDLCPSY